MTTAGKASSADTKKKMNGNLNTWLAGIGGTITGLVLGAMIFHLIQKDIHQDQQTKNNAIDSRIRLHWRQEAQPALEKMEGRIVSGMAREIKIALNGHDKENR